MNQINNKIEEIKKKKNINLKYYFERIPNKKMRDVKKATYV